MDSGPAEQYSQGSEVVKRHDYLIQRKFYPGDFLEPGT